MGQLPYTADLTPYEMSLFQNQSPLEMNKIARRHENPSESDEATASSPQKGVQRIETNLDKVFGFRRKLFQRGLNVELICDVVFVTPN